MNCLSKSVYIFCMTIILLPVTLTRQDTFSFFFPSMSQPHASINTVLCRGHPLTVLHHRRFPQALCQIVHCCVSNGAVISTGAGSVEERLWNPRILNERSLTLDHKTLAAPQVATLIKLSRIITARTGEKDTQSLSPMKATVSPPAKSP